MAERLTDEQLATVRQAAENAPHRGASPKVKALVDQVAAHMRDLFDSGEDRDTMRFATIYADAANPNVVLALLDEIEERRGERDDERERYAKIADEHDDDEEFDRGCRCGHGFDQHNLHQYEDAEPCDGDGCECVAWSPRDVAYKIRQLLEPPTGG